VLLAVVIGFFLDVLPTTLTYLNSVGYNFHRGFTPSSDSFSFIQLYFLLTNVALSGSIGNLIIPGWSLDAALCALAYTRTLFRRRSGEKSAVTTVVSSVHSRQLDRGIPSMRSSV
jgi:hypothetical protein